MVKALEVCIVGGQNVSLCWMDDAHSRWMIARYLQYPANRNLRVDARGKRTTSVDPTVKY